MQKLRKGRIIPHVIAIATFAVLATLFFYPQLEGKKIIQPDITQVRGMRQEVMQHAEETGHYPLWTNSMFSGMPVYMITMPTPGNKLLWVEKVTQLFVDAPIGWFFAAMVGMYILMLTLGAGPLLSAICAIAFGFSTNTLLLYEAGHTSKVRTIISAAPAIAGMLLTYRRQYLTGGALFAAAMGINFYVNHFQMTYYLLLCFGLYAIIRLTEAIQKKELASFGIASGILAAGLVLAMAASAAQILPTREYAEDTMRGKPILEQNIASAASSSVTKGLAWDYAMVWSNSGKDLLATFIPRTAGGSSQEKTGEQSEFYRALRALGVRTGTEIRAPLYHGDKPFTAGPAYFGASVCFLFVLSLFWTRGPLKWWLLSVIIMTFALSMGRHFPSFNKLVFDHLPFYNVFRAPSSMLSITAIFLPLGAVLALTQYFRRGLSAEDFRKGLYIATGITGGIALLIWLLGPSLIDFTGVNDAYYAQQGYPVDAILADRASFLRTDAMRSLIFVLIPATLLLAHHRGWLKKTYVITGIGLFILLDLWGIGRRYLDANTFSDRSAYDNAFQADEIDRQLLNDPMLHFRVHDMTRDPWNNSLRSYFHKTIGGYHAAKLQRYQDMIDYYLSKNHQRVFDMLNTKYFILPGSDGRSDLRTNFSALGNAWFVESIHYVNTADEEILAIENLDPGSEVVVLREFEEYLSGFLFDKNGTIRLTEYAPDRLVYVTNTQSEQLAVFSEVWYGPDKGWQAYIDGIAVPHFRANYILRAMRVPAGSHTIEFVFKPRSYAVGNTISIVVSSLIILILLYAIYREMRKLPPASEGTPEQTPAAPPVRKRAYRKKKKK